MGAAHADGKLAGSERDRVNAILAGMVAEHEVLSTINAQLEDFDPAGLDVRAACARLPASEEARRGLLQALAQVTDADGVQDLSESEYIQQVAECLGLTPEDWRKLAFEVVGSSSVDSSPVGGPPPPLPDDADES